MDNQNLTLEDIQLINEALDFLPKKSLQSISENAFSKGLRAFTLGGESAAKNALDDLMKKGEQKHDELKDRITLLQAKLIGIKYTITTTGRCCDSMPLSNTPVTSCIP
ncbi:MAG: hypothetical protein KF862_07345 [Chitinophagaceae bacterium]|nr:hypothetical protein [Chitinophagaceae bacterium]